MKISTYNVIMGVVKDATIKADIDAWLANKPQQPWSHMDPAALLQSRYSMAFDSVADGKEFSDEFGGTIVQADRKPGIFNIWGEGGRRRGGGRTGVFTVNAGNDAAKLVTIAGSVGQLKELK